MQNYLTSSDPISRDSVVVFTFATLHDIITITRTTSMRWSIPHCNVFLQSFRALPQHHRNSTVKYLDRKYGSRHTHYISRSHYGIKWHLHNKNYNNINKEQPGIPYHTSNLVQPAIDFDVMEKIKVDGMLYG